MTLYNDLDAMLSFLAACVDWPAAGPGASG